MNHKKKFKKNNFEEGGSVVILNGASFGSRNVANEWSKECN